MKKKIIKKIIKKKLLKMDLLEDLKMSLLSFNFAMIYIVHKKLVLLKNHLNYQKDSTFKCIFKDYHRLFVKKLLFII